MINAKEELLRIVGFEEIECANVYIEDRFKAVLYPNYTKEQYEKWLKSLDVSYDDDFGCQELYGSVLFKSGSWLTRGEYDGAEWWELHRKPTIEEILLDTSSYNQPYMN